MYKLIVKWRSLLLVYLTHKMALPMLKLFRKEQKFPYQRNELELFPADTLGHQLVRMLEDKQLELLPYYAKHDIKHILLEYDTTDEGEVSLQCFMLGNRHLSFPVIATVVYGMFTMPEHWSTFYKAYRRGKRSTEISSWKWFDLLHQPVEVLRRKLNPTSEFKNHYQIN